MYNVDREEYERGQRAEERARLLKEYDRLLRKREREWLRQYNAEESECSGNASARGYVRSPVASPTSGIERRESLRRVPFDLL
jgi:hypothetical protein